MRFIDQRRSDVLILALLPIGGMVSTHHHSISMSDAIAATRLWRSRAELERVRTSVCQWHKDRVAADKAHQYASQLEAVRVELMATVDRLAAELGKATGSTLATYENCARCDLAVGWLERVFDFFRDKFDQRKDAGNDAKDSESKRLAEAIRAADEVVWSCFRPFSRHDWPKEPAPLPYFDARYSPASVRRDKSLASVVDRGSGFEFLKDYLKTLPIPVLRLPMATVNTAWILVTVGHEVGHFVQPLVAAGYVEQFAALVAGVAQQAGGTKQDAEVWSDCAAEIFADWYSVAVMGPWALWAIAQFELSNETAMRQRRDRSGYPSAVVRLELMRQLADDASPPGTKLGTKVLESFTVNLGGAGAAADEQRDRSIAAALARRLRGEPLGALGPLHEVVGYDPADYGEGGSVVLWSKTLKKELGQRPDRKLEEARHIASASAAVASSDGSGDDASRRAFASSLRDETFARISASAVEGTRGVKGEIAVQDPGQALSSLLLGLGLPSEMPQG
jgi:hypothetical protein